MQVGLAWSMARNTLTREQIIKAAIELLDSEGLDGLSMRVLGRRLGSAATAVYWHVGSKENLIALAGDHVWNEVVLPDPAAMGWRTAAFIMASDVHAMLVRHLWLVQAFGAHMIYGPGKARHDDHNLAIYEAAGFDAGRADQAATAVFIFVLGAALGHSAAASLARKLSRDGADAQQTMRDSMAKAREIAARFPRLRVRLDTAPSNYVSAPDDSFEFGLQAIFDGVESQLVSSPTPA